MYELIYETPDGYTELDLFEGSWLDLQEEIRKMRQNGYTNISATSLDQD